MTKITRGVSLVCDKEWDRGVDVDGCRGEKMKQRKVFIRQSDNWKLPAEAFVNVRCLQLLITFCVLRCKEFSQKLVGGRRTEGGESEIAERGKQQAV